MDFSPIKFPFVVNLFFFFFGYLCLVFWNIYHFFLWFYFVYLVRVLTNLLDIGCVLFFIFIFGFREYYIILYFSYIYLLMFVWYWCVLFERSFLHSYLSRIISNNSLPIIPFNKRVPNRICTLLCIIKIIRHFSIKFIVHYWILFVWIWWPFVYSNIT